MIILKRGEAITDSRVVAEKFNKRHRDVVSKIEKLISDLDKIKGRENSPLRFIKKTDEYKGQTYHYYEMNRPAFSLFVMGMTGKKALVWKTRFNDAFYEMEKVIYQQLLNQQSDLWLAQREQAKLTRRQETDVIKKFVEYATRQGSKNAKFYYKHITSATYKCLGLIQYKRPKLRETLNLMQTSQLILAEKVAQKSLEKYMNEGEHYKAIFALVRVDLENFADSFLLPNNGGQQ